MRRLKGAALGIWEFVAGDDWMTALGVVLALGLTGLMGGDDGSWFVIPAAVAILLPVSIWREARKRDRA
jgi:hypothetical protein